MQRLNLPSLGFKLQDIYRDEAYVRAELESMALQLQEVAQVEHLLKEVSWQGLD